MVFVMRVMHATPHHVSDRHPGLEPGPIHPPRVRLPNGSRLKAGMTSECVSHNE